MLVVLLLVQIVGVLLVALVYVKDVTILAQDLVADLVVVLAQVVVLAAVVDAADVAVVVDVLVVALAVLMAVGVAADNVVEPVVAGRGYNLC